MCRQGTPGTPAGVASCWVAVDVAVAAARRGAVQWAGLLQCVRPSWGACSLAPEWGRWGGKVGGCIWAKRFSNATGRARRGVDCFRFKLGSASPPTSPGPEEGAHGKLSGKFAVCCSLLWSCRHASPGGAVPSVSPASFAVRVPSALLERDRWPPLPSPLQRGQIAVFVPPATSRGGCCLRLPPPCCPTSASVSHPRRQRCHVCCWLPSLAHRSKSLERAFASLQNRRIGNPVPAAQ